MMSKYISSKYNRWERQKEVLLLLNGNCFSVKDLSDYLDIDVVHSDCLLRYYHRNNQLKRKKIEGKFHYTLTDYGLKHLKWLEEGGHLEYVEWYNRKYKNGEDVAIGNIKDDLSAIKKLSEEWI